MPTITLKRPFAFKLESATEFYSQFIPGSGMAAAAVEGLTLAFRLDDTFQAVAARLRQTEAEIFVDYAGTSEEELVRAQVSRILGLEENGDEWAKLGERVPLVGRLQREFPGFFTAAKSSPYDAATWAVIAPRMPMKNAAKVKLQMTRDWGDAVELGGQTHFVFPSPATLVSIERVEGLAEEKVVRLRGVARAALEGKLCPRRLRALGEERALAELQELRGVGPWAASHIFYRGAAPADALPTAEPRVLHGLADALEVPAVSEREFIRQAESWSPFRMWVCVLLSRHLARTDGWRAPSLAAERAKSGRDLAKKTKMAAPRTTQRSLPGTG